MTDKENEKRPSGLRRRLIAVSMLLLCLAAALLLCLSLYLNGSHAPRLLSRILTDYLQQPLTVDATSLDGDLISLRGITLANPPGTPPGYLCRVDTLTLAPDWGGLLRGKRSLRLLALSGIRIDLRRDRSGVWNFSPLQRQLASRKSSGSELSIASLRISEGAISIDGRQLRGLNLRLTDLTTKGSNEARLEISFRDPGRNRYTLAGTLRPGTEPALDLTLSAPSISPVSLAAALGLKSPALLTESRAGVSMNATLHGKKFQVRGSLNFTALTVAHATPTADPPQELNGRVDLAASYDMAEERAQLESLELKLNDRVAGHATASLERVRTLRRFSVDMSISRVELNRLGFLLPKKERERTRIFGSLESGGIHLEGDAQQGVRKASGSVMLRDASLRRDGRLIFDRLDAPVSLSRSPGGFFLKGRLVRRGKGGEGLLERLEAPFQVVLTSRLKLEGARIPRLSAGIMGISVNGRGGLEPASTNPLNASLKITAPSLPRVVSLAGLSGLAIGSGACSLSLDAAGRGVRDFAAKAMLVLSSMTGTRGTHSFTLGEGRLDSRLIMSRGALRASGTGRLNALAVDKKSGEGRFDFEFSGKTVRLRDAQARMDKTSLSIGAVELMLPVREKVGGRVRTPLSIRITTGVISREELRMEGISGMLQTDLVSEAASKWLEGRGECTVGGITWKGKRLGNPKLLLSFSRPGARGELGGTLLGGTLDGKFDVDPFAVSRGVNFRGGITGAQAAIIGELLPRRGDARLSSGTLGGSCSGSLTGDGTLSCSFQSSGSGMEARGAGNKTLFSAAGYRLSGSFSPDRLHINSSRITVGEKLRVELGGDVANPLSPGRKGSINFTLPTTPLNDMVDPFVNMLPRLIQEASTEGSLASRGSLILGNGRVLLEGSLGMDGIVLDIPSQKIRVAEISGTLPISLALSGGSPAEAGTTSDFNRSNYGRILERLRKSDGSGQTLTLGSVSFGPLTLGTTNIRVSASNGVTRITSLRSSLYEGALLGNGSVMFRDGLRYRADLLINGLSLKLLCASVPGITDYISGRVDGLISLGNVGGGKVGLVGFSELWAREGNGEKMLVSRVFLQKLSGKKLSGFFFRNDRPFDQAKISAQLQGGYLTFDSLDISHTNIFGVRDLSVTIVPSQNRIALDHLFNSIKQAATRGKAAAGRGGETTGQPAAAEPEFKWNE